MPDSESKKRWKSENTRNLVININKNTDPEIFAWLEKLKTPYGKEIKAAIKQYIASHPNGAEIKEKYTYGMRLRGFAPGAQPKGVKERRDDLNGDYYDIIVYDRELTEDEIQQYELDPID